MQLHWPLVQLWPPVHTWPHEPQFDGSIIRLMHLPAHVALPDWHWHFPAVQVWPDVHASLHEPQSESVPSGFSQPSEGSALQSAKPALHAIAHAPDEQEGVPFALPHGPAQSAPHPH